MKNSENLHYLDLLSWCHYAQHLAPHWDSWKAVYCLNVGIGSLVLNFDCHHHLLHLSFIIDYFSFCCGCCHNAKLKYAFSRCFLTHHHAPAKCAFASGLTIAGFNHPGSLDLPNSPILKFTMATESLTRSIATTDWYHLDSKRIYYHKSCST